MSQRRLLLVVDEAVAEPPVAVPEPIRRRLKSYDEIRVVAPALNSALRAWVSDIDGAVLEADGRLQTVLGQLTRAGLDPVAEVGDGDPLTAIDDIVSEWPPDMIVLVIHEPGDERYREHELLTRARARFGCPIEALLLDRDGQILGQIGAEEG